MAAVVEVYPENLDETSEAAQDMERFNHAAIWMLCVGVFGIVVAAVSALVRGLYHYHIIKYPSLVPTIKVRRYTYYVYVRMQQTLLYVFILSITIS